MASSDRPPVIEKGRKPTKTILVPLEYRAVTLTRERDHLVHDVWIKTNCVIVPCLSYGKVTHFDVFGLGTEQAVALINEWISNVRVKSRATKAWAKTPAFNANDWYYGKVAEMEDDRKQQFLGPTPEDAPDMSRVTVEWPADLLNYSVTPRDAFGNKLEALNKLRIRDNVYITLLPNVTGFWQVEIMGENRKLVQIAEKHYRNMIEQVRVETFGMRRGVNIILDEAEGDEVKLELAGEWWPNRSDSVVPRLEHLPTMSAPGSYRDVDLDTAKLALIQSSVRQALETIRSKKGSYDFAIRLGCLVLGSQKIPADQIGRTFPQDEFLQAIDSKIDLMVKKWAFDDETGCRVLKQFIAAGDFLEPIRAAGHFGHLPSTLQDTIPMFRGTWVFRDPTAEMSRGSSAAPGASISLYIVQVEWSDDEYSKYEKTDMRFYKLGSGQKGPKVNMEVNLLELGESRAWSFALESLVLIPRQLVSPALVGFAKSVTMKPGYKIESREPFATWDSTPTIRKNLATHRLEKIYSFGIQETCYKVELAALCYGGHPLPVWGLCVRHMHWETLLAELERLPIGEKGCWGDSVAAFLPEDGLMPTIDLTDKGDQESEAIREDQAEETCLGGIAILTKALMQVSTILSPVTVAGGVAL